MTAETVVTDLINSAIERGSESATAAISFAQAAQTAALNIISLNPPPPITEPNVTIPEFDPTVDFTGDFLRGYNDAIADFDPDFQREVTAYINRFFPNNIGCLKTQIDGWLCDTVQFGGTGIPANVENAIWQRDREREVIESRRAEDEIIKGYSGRGWELASEFLANQLSQVRQGLEDKISASSRDRAIENSKIEIENIRFAVEQGIKLRLGAVDALVNFLRAHAQMKELAIEKAKALLEAKTKLFSSIGAYYQAIIGAAALVLDFDKLRSDNVIRQQEIIIRGATENTNSRVNAAISAANAMGAIAAAALSSQNSVAEISNATIEST